MYTQGIPIAAVKFDHVSAGHILEMRGRRRDPRFALTVPWEGSLRLPEDVTIERRTETEVWVVSATPAHRGQQLTLDLMDAGVPETLQVEVTGSAPILVDGVIRHGLRLAIVRKGERAGHDSPTAVERTGS